MSFQARGTLVTVLVFLGVYGWYFGRVFSAAQAGPVDAIDYQPLLLVMVGVLVALALAMLEREPFWIAHTLLGGLVLAEVVKGAFKLMDYRRGV